jgi:antitoxin MazE
MTKTIIKYDNGLGIQLPKSVLQNLNISENDKMEIRLNNDIIMIKKVAEKKHRSTRERLIEFYNMTNSQDNEKPTEIDWGKPRGQEIW